MKKSAILLGGAGFIGYNIARYLAEHRDYDLTIADDFSSGKKDAELDALCAQYRIRLIAADLSRSDSYNLFDAHYDYVYVLASVVGVNRCIEEPEEVIRINTAIILNTVEWLKRAKPERVLFASSSENYAAATDTFNYPVPTDEHVPLCVADTRHPRFTYAVTKILGESAFFAYGKKLGIHTVIIRYQNIYGPRMGFKHAIPHIIERMYKGENPVKIYGGEQTRAFCYCDDGAEGTVKALESEQSNQQVYHIGNEDEITIDAMTRAIGSIMGYKGAYEAGPTYLGSVSRRCPDIGKAKRELGYAPQVPLQAGLQKTVAWYKTFFDSGQAISSGGFKPPEALNYHSAEKT
jgi:nucleoside-diphosphate-sugar epimerase